ncbi:MAG: hypothetical protein GY859_14425 [Desulfobacterales bacterium]|nr:hypothetical protein [Desulfobacterales bacterium]
MHGAVGKQAGEEVLERIISQQRPGSESGGAAQTSLARPLSEALDGSKSEKETISVKHRGTEPPPERAADAGDQTRTRTRLQAGINRLFTMVLRELKPEMLTLEKYLDAADDQVDREATAGHREIQRTVGELIRGIDQQQTTAAARDQSPDAMQMISHELLLKESDQKARLKIFYRKKKRDREKRDHRASLQLKMNKIGDIRTDFVLAGKRLDITFHVNSLEVKNKIEERAHAVRGRLTELVEDLSMEVRISEKKPTSGVDEGPSDFGETRIVDIKV